MSSIATVLRAFSYLQALSLYNGVRQRLLRLRQPKYLFGAIAGVAYFYFFVIRHTFENSVRHAGSSSDMPAEIMPLFAVLAAAALLVFVLIAWLLPGDRAALQFSEAEVAFLFPAPLSRVALIQFTLLRSQLAIFFSAFLMSLLLRKGNGLAGSAFHHAIGIWMVLATVKLHFMGASFARERLLDLGMRPIMRRAIVLAVVALVAAGCWWWMQRNLSLPRRQDLADARAVIAYVGAVLGTPPVTWLLMPFKAMVAPFFTAGTSEFLRSLVPAVALLALHYLWVVRSHVSFEEASIDHARRRAERSQARREGKRENAPKKPRDSAFPLAPQGFVPIAFLWKGLIAAGPFWRLRSFLIIAAVIFAGGFWLGAAPSRLVFLKVAGIFIGMFSVWLLIGGPMFMQRGLRRTFEYLDVLKASPVRGWQIALGELLTPMVMLAFAQWLLLLAMTVCLVLRGGSGLLSAPNVISAAIGIALVNLPLCGLMMCLPFAGMLVFPAWLISPGGREAGVEVMGQRLIFVGVYLVSLAIALIPAVVVGAIAWFLVQLFAPLAAALLVSAALAAVVLALEFGAAIHWLGKRVDGIDVALELRQ